MSNRFSVYVLAEGKRDQLFVREVLKSMGVGRREMLFAPVSHGHGSGKKRVLDQFAEQVQLCRRRSSRALTSLIVIMDADDQTVDRCLSDLDARLQDSGQARIDRRRDWIARLIPKRNIETWILFLISDSEGRDSVNEETDFKNSKSVDAWDRVTPAASDRFFEWCFPQLHQSTNLLDSLRRGIDEMARAVPHKK